MGGEVSTEGSPSSSIRVAHLGNSIQYFNDCPRLLEWMLKTKYDNVTQDSCLRGGATLRSLFEQGNGMMTKFGSPQAMKEDGTYDIGRSTIDDLLSRENNLPYWDFIIVNDHTQAPARPEKKQRTIKSLKESYLPLLTPADNTQPFPTVVFLMTAAYRKPVKNADELGTFDEFTAKIQAGYNEYQALVPNSKVAPVGLAFQHVRNHYKDDQEFHWEHLYARDDFHPSPHGTLLEAYVLYATIVGEQPPLYDPSWWETARYMQPPDVEPLPLPTLEEGRLLRRVACEVCGIAGEDHSREDPDSKL